MNLTKALINTIAAGIISIIFIAILASKSAPSDPVKRVEFFKKNGDWPELVVEYKARISSFPLSPAYHYEYLNSVSYEIDWTESSRIKKEYEAQSTLSDSQVADIGHFGVGFIYMEMGKYDKALKALQQVQNQQLPYLNSLMGNAFWALGNTSEAAWHYSQDVRLKGNLQASVRNLTNILLWERNLEALQSLMDDPATAKYVPLDTQKRFHYISGNTSDFLLTFVKGIFFRSQWMGIMAAILIALIWINFVTKLNLFTKENVPNMLLCLLSGVVFSLAFGLYKEAFQQAFYDQLTTANGFIVWLVNIIALGIPAELLKLLPLLLLMKFTTTLREPTDYILYASLTAIGFGFIEGSMFPIGYEYNINPLSIRVTIATVTHMFLTATIAYGLVLNQWRYQKIKAIRLMVLCLISITVAGLYYTAEVRDWPVLSFFLALGLLMYWCFYMNNSLNHAKKFDHRTAIQTRPVFKNFMNLLTVLVILEYGAYAFTYGISQTYQFSAYLVLAGLAVNIVMFLIGRGFQVVSGEWRSFGSMAASVLIQFDTDEVMVAEGLDDVLDQRIMMKHFSNNEFAAEYLPNQGMVLNRYQIKGDFRWFLVELDQPGHLQGYHEKYVFVKPKEMEEAINGGDEILVGMYLIEEHMDPFQMDRNGRGLAFVHWIRTRIA